MNEVFETGNESLQPEEEGNIFKRLLWIFLSPSKLFADINRSPSWWQPWVWISIISIAGVKLFFPIQMALLQLNPKGQSEEQLAEAMEMMSKFYAAGYLSAPVAVIIQALLVALIGYVALSIITAEANFKKYFTIYLYSYIIIALGSLLSVLLVRQRGIENIDDVGDATVSFGLDFLVSSGHKYLHALAGSINVFSVWSYILVAMGLMQIFRLTRQQAIAAVIPLWLIFAIFSLVGTKLSGLM